MSTQSSGTTSPAQTEANSNITAAQFSAAMRAKREAQPAAASDKTDQPPVENETATHEGGEETQTQQPAGNEVLSKVLQELEGIDLATISDTEREKLAKLLRSKAVDRFGELTKAKRTLEEQLATLKAEKEKDQPFVAAPKDNPFADISSVDGLQGKFEEVTAHIEWAENLLDGNEGLSLDDTIVWDGKEYTKRVIKDSLKAARKAKEQYLPAQYKQVIEREERKVSRQLVEENVQKELPALFSNSEAKAKYDALRDGIDLDAIERVNPTLAVQLPEILAHYVNSKHVRSKTAVAAGGNRPAITPPSSPAGVAGGVSPSSKQESMIKELSNRFSESQSTADWLALRAAQRQKSQTS